jgi:hypothetical protein
MQAQRTVEQSGDVLNSALVDFHQVENGALIDGQFNRQR